MHYVAVGSYINNSDSCISTKYKQLQHSKA